MKLLFLFACATAPEPRWTVDGALAPTFALVDVDHDGAISEAEYDHVAFSAPKFDKADVDGNATIDAAEFRTLALDADPLTFYAKAYDGDVRAKHKKKGEDAGGGGQSAPAPGAGGPDASRGPGGAGLAGGPGGPGGPGGQGGRPGGRPGGPAGPGGPGERPEPPAGAVSAKRKGPGRMPDAYYVFQIMREEVLAVDPQAALPDVERVIRVGAAGSFRSKDAVALERDFEAAYEKAGLTYPDRLRHDAPVSPATLDLPDGPPPPPEIRGP